MVYCFGHMCAALLFIDARFVLRVACLVFMEYGLLLIVDCLMFRV